MAKKRKIGDPAPESERKKWSYTKLIQNIRMSIRFDYGGKDPIKIISNRIRESLKLNGYKIDENIIKVLAEDQFIANRNVQQGIQERVSRNLDEIYRRLVADDATLDLR